MHCRCTTLSRYECALKVYTTPVQATSILGGGAKMAAAKIQEMRRQ